AAGLPPSPAAPQAVGGAAAGTDADGRARTGDPQITAGAGAEAGALREPELAEVAAALADSAGAAGAGGGAGGARTAGLPDAAAAAARARLADPGERRARGAGGGTAPLDAATTGGALVARAAGGPGVATT